MPTVKKHSRHHSQTDEPEYKAEALVSPTTSRGTFFAYDKTNQEYEYREILTTIKAIADNFKQNHVHKHGPLPVGIKKLELLFLHSDESLLHLNVGIHALEKMLHQAKEIAKKYHSTNPEIREFYAAMLNENPATLYQLLNKIKKI